MDCNSIQTPHYYYYQTSHYIYTLICPFLGQWWIIVQRMNLTTCAKWNAPMCHKFFLQSSDGISDLTQYVTQPGTDFNKLPNSTIQQKWGLLYWKNWPCDVCCPSWRIWENTYITLHIMLELTEPNFFEKFSEE